MYKLAFLDNVRFLVSSLSSLSDNLAEGLYKSKYRDCKASLECMITKDDLKTFKCLDCNKTYEKKFDGNLLRRFQNTNKFGDGNYNNFCLMLWKCLYPYEYMNG